MEAYIGHSPLPYPNLAVLTWLFAVGRIIAMDVPMRVGLGGTALFTLAGLASPILGWWIAGPIMAACALVAAWGFWPLAPRIQPASWPVRVPLHVAATRAYEAAEKAGILDLTTSATSPPDSRLNHFKLLFMVDAETELFGVRPPSTKSRLIPKADLQGHDLYPANGETSQINHLLSTESIAYTDVTVRRKDLRRVINGYIAEARRIGN
jgi:hypothetical protein